jgi:hypothetical protein
MPQYVVKPDPERDEYVYWSTITESPYFAGTRAEMVAYLRGRDPQDFDARMERADLRGTSALWPDLDAPYLGWGDTTIYEQRGVIKTADMGTLARRLDAGQDVTDLLEPFDDDDDVRDA